MNPPVLTLDLTLPTEHTFVRTTRRAVAGWLEDAGVPEGVRTDVVMALGEACTNVVQHAFPTGDGVFRVHLELHEDEVVAEVTDRGVGFEAFEQATAARPRYAPRGRGFEIMRRLVEWVEVESAPRGGTRIRLRQALGDPTVARDGAGG